MTKQSKVAVTFAEPFRFAPDGVTVVDYPVGKAEVSPRCAEVAELAGKLKKAAPKKTADEKAKAEAAEKAKAEADEKAKASGSAAPEKAASAAAPENAANSVSSEA